MNVSIFEYLKKNLIFSHLDSYMFQIVERHLGFQELQANEFLYVEGEHGDSMAFVLIGQLDVIKKGMDGQSVVVYRMGSGDSIGEMALIDDLTRSASVKATEMTALVTLSRQNFELLIQDFPRIGVAMLQGIATVLSLHLRRMTGDKIYQKEKTEIK